MKGLNSSLAFFVLFLPLLLPSNSSFPITDGTKKLKTIDTPPRKIYTSLMFEHWNFKQSGTKCTITVNDASFLIVSCKVVTCVSSKNVLNFFIITASSWNYHGNIQHSTSIVE